MNARASENYLAISRSRRSSLVECVSVLHGTCLQNVDFFFINLHLHLQDTSKLQCVEDFLEGMLGKLKFE